MSFTNLSQEDLGYVEDIYRSGENLYLAYDLLALKAKDADHRFWFQEAAKINRLANGVDIYPDSGQGAHFTIILTTYGLALDAGLSILGKIRLRLVQPESALSYLGRKLARIWRKCSDLFAECTTQSKTIFSKAITPALDGLQVDPGTTSKPRDDI